MSEQENQTLYLKTIYELLEEQFYIPAYQRGYRWSEIQVRELLDDIWEFSRADIEGKASFYCLQPIVVVKRDSCWELVDGQQRLTTLYLILHYLEREHLRRDLQDAFKKPLFSLEYETRKDSRAFLNDIKENQAGQNIDYYHIVQAFQKVAEWFGDRDYNDNDAFLRTLLAKPGQPNSVKVIWYDLTYECMETDYAIDVFSRINIGKIPLTNAELIKALFLQSSNFEKEPASLKQIQIATEWDTIEQALQESSFWYFIYDPDARKKYDSRIEFIFDLMKGKSLGDETFFTFHRFNEAFSANREEYGRLDVDSLWKEVKDYFLTFNEWYCDRELYHLIGFLVDCGRSVNDLKTLSEGPDTTKTQFKSCLKAEIKKEVNCSLDELAYGDSKLRKVLLLFNIQTLLATKEADVRFPFDRYKQEKWDIEHIRSQTDREIRGSSRREWMEDVLEYFTDNRDPDAIDTEGLSGDVVGFIESIRELLSAEKIDDDSFESLYAKITEYFKEDDVAWVDGIGNLALLDARTNRSYKNAMFPIKRRRIIQNDMNGVFAPICTKNVFLKFYSKKLDEVMYWNESDANDYSYAIKSILESYLPDQENSND